MNGIKYNKNDKVKMIWWSDELKLEIFQWCLNVFFWRDKHPEDHPKWAKEQQMKKNISKNHDEKRNKETETNDSLCYYKNLTTNNK